MYYAVNSICEKRENKRHKNVDFFNVHNQGNPVIDDVLRVKSNFTIIDYYSLSLQFVIK